MEQIADLVPSQARFFAESTLHAAAYLIDAARLRLDAALSTWPLWQIPLLSAVFTLLLLTLLRSFRRFYFFLREGSSPPGARLRAALFRAARRLPFVEAKVKAELEKTRASLTAALTPKGGGAYLTRLPVKGMTKEEILKKIDDYDSMCSVKWRQGRASGAVYGASLPEIESVAGTVYNRHMWTNPLHPDLFPNIQKMESEIIKMAANLFHGGEDACGSISNGGTESIMLAVRCYRNWARRQRGIDRPELVAPRTAHAAFDKAAESLGVKLVKVQEDPVTRRADHAAMRAAINRNTIALVVSAPQFPHGAIDPIGAVAAIGVAAGVPVHVDACLGGFLLPFMDDAGFTTPPFDFRVDGVVSISVDTHKYGFAPKGTSLILYKSEEWRSHQYFVQTDWPGGIYATPTFAGSRPGALIAATWASLLHLGVDGYRDATRRIVETRVKIQRGVEAIEGLRVEGAPEASVVAVASDRFNIFRLSTELSKRGWSLNPLQFPPCFHICVTLMQTQDSVADDFLLDIAGATKEIMKDPARKCGGVGAIYGMAAAIEDRSLVGELAIAYMDTIYAVNEEQKWSQDERKELAPKLNLPGNMETTSPVSEEQQKTIAEASSGKEVFSPSNSKVEVAEGIELPIEKQKNTSTTTTMTTRRKSSRRTTSLDILYQNIK